MAPGRDPLSRRSEAVEGPININETDARGAVRVGLIRQLVVSLFTAVAVMGTVWALSVSL
jgi:hypothetical protein